MLRCVPLKGLEHNNNESNKQLQGAQYRQKFSGSETPPAAKWAEIRSRDPFNRKTELSEEGIRPVLDES